MTLHKHKVNLLLTATFLILCLPCFAQPFDHQQAIHLQADWVDINQSTHTGIYIGHIKLNQGNSHLNAAHAITKTNTNNQLVEAVARGDKTTQAHYWTQTTPDKPPLHAYADTIYYYPEQHRIELIGNARLEQGKQRFFAPKIYYDTLHQQVITEKDGNMRTTLIIHPEKTS